MDLVSGGSQCPSVPPNSSHSHGGASASYGAGTATGGGSAPVSERIVSLVESSSNNPIPCVKIINDNEDDERARSLLQNIATQFQDGNPATSTSNGEADSGRGLVQEESPTQLATESLETNGTEIQETPSLQITFFNTDIGRKYRHDIEKFFHTLMTAENISKSHEPLPVLQPRPNLDLSTGCVTSTTIIGQMEVYRWFTVDRQGWPMVANMLNQTPGIDLPQYIQQYQTDPYPPPDDAEIVETKPIKTSKKCFNCGGDDHEVRKCPKPFDKRTFQRNKAKFLASGLQYGRYHKEDGGIKAKPGHISDNLRYALGLNDNQLPRHIYQMRRLGYPPGWLLEAEATNSGLAMFDKHGREVDLDGDRMEDGQVPEHRIRDEENLKYNADKLVAYPGFNVPCPNGIVDEALRSRHYPKMNDAHNLEKMSSQINIVPSEEDLLNSRKRTMYGSDDGESSKRRKSHHLDMELSDDDADSPDIEVAEGPFPPEYEVIDELPPEPPGETSNPSSPLPMVNIDETLNALEEEKQKLLAELNQMEENLTGDGSSATESGMLEIPAAEDGSGITAERPVTPLEPQQSHQSLCYQVTTPIIQHTSIDKLPSIDKFSDGITEHLPYENLPNSTGVFEKMSGIMKNVKEKMAKIRPKRKSKK